MATIGNLNVVISASAAGLISGLGRAASAVSSFAAGITASIGVGGGGGGIAAILGVGSIAAVKLAADLEQSKIAFEVMFGSAEKGSKVLSDIQKFAAETPFESPELISGAKLLAAYGFAAEDLVSTLRAVGDIASATGQPIGELVQLVGKLKVQGRAMAEDINQFTGRGVPLIQELAKNFGVTDGEVRGLVESGKVGFAEVARALNNLVSAGGKYAGMTARQSQSTKGLFSTVLDNAKLALTGVGDAIIEGLGLQNALRNVGEFTDGLKAKAESLKPVFAAIGDVAGVAFDAIKAGATFVSDTVGQVIDQLGGWNLAFTTAKSVAIEVFRVAALGVNYLVEAIRRVEGAIRSYLIAPLAHAVQAIADMGADILEFVGLPGGAALRQMADNANAFARDVGQRGDEMMAGMGFDQSKTRINTFFDGLKTSAKDATKSVTAEIGKIAGAEGLGTLQSAATNVIKSLATPFDKFQQQFGQLQEMFDAGFLTADQYALAAAKAFEPLGKEGGIGTKFASLDEMGSAGAVSAAARHRLGDAGGGNVQERIRQVLTEQKAIQQRQLDEARKLAEAFQGAEAVMLLER